MQALAQDERRGIVEEIIVTAQKREQSLEEVPISISVMPGEQLQAQGFNNLEENRHLPSPGVIAEQGATGITSTVHHFAAFSSAGANTAFEQIRRRVQRRHLLRASIAVRGRIYDVQQVEVLFGPQPVYFGQSAIAGLVSYKSNRPEPGAMDGYAFAEAGNLAHRKMEGALTVPLGESWAARVGGKFQETDGWMTDQYSGEDGNASENTAYRVSLAGGAGDLSAFLKHEGFKQITSGFNTDDPVCNPQARPSRLFWPPLRQCSGRRLRRLRVRSEPKPGRRGFSPQLCPQGPGTGGQLGFVANCPFLTTPSWARMSMERTPFWS